jgi:RNA polymerase sigma factor (sigma-70 family)
MKALQDKDVPASTSGLPSFMGDAAEEPASFAYQPHRRPRAETTLPWTSWESRSARWTRLMKEAQGGDEKAYQQLLRELDAWLFRYYARRLPYPAAEDARQDALLAIHAKRDTYEPSRPFGAWLAAIAHYKWVDRIREASRYSTLPLDEETEMSIEDHGEAAISAATLDLLLGQLKPAQESVIRLVKLKGLSVARASGVTGQSASLVKINIHRGLKKLAALVS